MTEYVFHCPENASGVLEYGVGFNWYDGYGPGEPDNRPTYPDLGDRPGWEAVREALDDLHPGLLRFGIPADKLIHPQTGGLDFQSVHLQRLEWVAHWAEANGCTILLDTWKIPGPYRFPEPANLKEQHDQETSMAAADNRAYAREFVAPLLKYVTAERGLKAVKMFNPFNEPLMYGPYQTPDNKPDAYVHYVEMFREIQSALSENGLWPGRIKLFGVDCIHADRFPALEMLARGVDIDPYLDGYTIHYYFHRFDWMNPVSFKNMSPLGESLDRQSLRLRKYCTQRGKPLLAAEVGWFPQCPSGQESFDAEGSARHFAALITAETIIRAMNAGLAGFAIWSILNPNIHDGHWRVISIHDGQLWKAPHLYPAYRLLSRYARPGSKFYPLGRPVPREEPWQHVHATVLQTPDNKLVIYAVNDNLVETRAVKFVLPAAWGKRKFAKYIKDEVRPGMQSGETECLLKDGLLCIEDYLMPMSLTAYVEV
jgi:hypothetical protein